MNVVITIVEDDIHLRNELSELLRSNGYETQPIDVSFDLLEVLKRESMNLILLDVNLPYENGFEICRQLRKEKKVPIIFVTSRNCMEDELESIRSGGIDFITKPYNKLILLEKIKRVLVQNPVYYQEIVKGEYVLNLPLSILKYRQQEVELTRNEFRILYYFFTHDGVISKEALLEDLWNDKYYLDESILLVNINRLRKKASSIGILNLIVTVRGKGYRL